MLTGPECTNFIETKAFDRLKTKILADGNSDPILLLGPKGCGKTLSLVALLTILVNLGKPALYLTSKTLRSIQMYTFLQYTRQFLEGIDKSSNVENLERTLHNSVKSVTAFGLLQSKYIHRFCDRDEHKLFILTDFSQMQRNSHSAIAASMYST